MDPIESAKIIVLAVLVLFGAIVLGIGVSQYKLPRSDDINVQQLYNELNQTASKKAKWWMVAGVGIIAISCILILVLLI